MRRGSASGGRRFQTHRRALCRWWRASVLLDGERRPDTGWSSLLALSTAGRPRTAAEILRFSPRWTIRGCSGLRRLGRRTFRLLTASERTTAGHPAGGGVGGRGRRVQGEGSSCGSPYYFRETPRKAGHARVGGWERSPPIPLVNCLLVELF